MTTTTCRDILLGRATRRASEYGRNDTGLWLACQLRDQGYSKSETETVLVEYANHVSGNAPEPYTMQEAIATLSSVFARPPRPKRRGGYSPHGGECQTVNVTPARVQKGVDTPTDTSPNASNGLTVAALGEAKKLPVNTLKSYGVSDFKLGSTPVVRIPYYGEDATEASVRFRLALQGDARFRWRKRNKALPYGLDRLGVIRKAGWVLVVEGESDCWTCWYYGIPALGVPGKGVWKPEWKEYLTGLKVWVWQEPEAQDFTMRILATAPDLRYIAAPEGVKDLADAHAQGLDVPVWLERLKLQAESGAALQRRLANVQLEAAYQASKHILEAPDPLSLIGEEIQGLGYGGDLKPAIITYLAATSRLLEMRRGAMPVHLLLTGHSSGGKSYTVGIVKALLPAEAYHEIDAGSPRVLIYDDAPLQHRVLIFGEADSLPAGEDNPAASAIRNLLQDHYLHYDVTVRDETTGEYRVKRVEKAGPTVLITTSTRALGDQLMTRMFALEMSDSRQQIVAALQAQAKLEARGERSADPGLVALQEYLQFTAPVSIVVPYVDRLAEAIACLPVAPRVTRDFSRLVSLVKSVAILRQHSRKRDGAGRVMAELADYETVRALVNDMYIDSTTGVTRDVQALVAAVVRLDHERMEGEGITNTLLATQLGTGVKQVTRRAKRAIKSGWLVNREQRKGYPADYAPGEPMPETDGLPRLQGTGGGDNRMSTPHEAMTDSVDTLTPSTDSETPPTPIDFPSVLRMPLEEVIDLWRSLDEPTIEVSPGELCTDLATLLASRSVKPEHLDAVNRWVQSCGCIDERTEVNVG